MVSQPTMWAGAAANMAFYYPLLLPAAPTLGLTQLVPYYLPVVTTLMLVLRCVSYSTFQ